MLPVMVSVSYCFIFCVSSWVGVAGLSPFGKELLIRITI